MKKDKKKLKKKKEKKKYKPVGRKKYKPVGRKWAMASRVEMMLTWPYRVCAKGDGRWGEGWFYFKFVIFKWSSM